MLPQQVGDILEEDGCGFLGLDVIALGMSPLEKVLQSHGDRSLAYNLRQFACP
jgi:hypothetical protein